MEELLGKANEALSHLLDRATDLNVSDKTGLANLIASIEGVRTNLSYEIREEKRLKELKDE